MTGGKQANCHRAYISVGSNIEPEKHIAQAREMLAAEENLIQVATAIKTAPDGYQDQPDFLNTAFLVATALDLEAFNAYLKRLEIRLGRIKGAIKSGPRVIDLDIIIWDGVVVHDDYPEKSYVSTAIDELLPAWKKDGKTQT